MPAIPIDPFGLDLYLDWNSDLILTPNGSIQMASGWDRIRQRIIRHLITNPSQVLPSGRFTPADYVFNPQFGIGLGSMVDQPLSTTGTGSQTLADIERRIAQAVLQDADIDSTSPPSVKFFRQAPSTLFIIIGVTLISGVPGQIAVRYGPPQAG